MIGDIQKGFTIGHNLRLLIYGEVGPAQWVHDESINVGSKKICTKNTSLGSCSGNNLYLGRCNITSRTWIRIHDPMQRDYIKIGSCVLRVAGKWNPSINRMFDLAVDQTML